MTVRLDRLGHLTSRFFGSVRAKPVPPADVAWVRSVLTAEEFAMWERLGRADCAESVAVGRDVQRRIGAADGPWIAAALLHDVGKVEARLGSVRRSLATVVAGVVGHDRVRRWRSRPGWRGRIGRYIAHDDLGAALLHSAGARPQAVYWAKVHHRPERWDGRTIPAETCRALARADGERIRD
jgi:hypothetical protein